MIKELMNHLEKDTKRYLEFLKVDPEPTPVFMNEEWHRQWAMRQAENMANSQQAGLYGNSNGTGLLGKVGIWRPF